MAATKYQVMYRYVNESTNMAITNSSNEEYNPTMEFYVDDGDGKGHKMFNKNPKIQLEAQNEQQEMLSFGNNADNPKTNMLFAYDGVKKIQHKVYVESSTGYVVENWDMIDRSAIGKRGDFSKEFTTLDGETPESGGTVVCSEAVMKKYFPQNTITVVSNNDFADKLHGANPYYSEARIEQLIRKSMIFKLTTDSWKEHTVQSNTTRIQTGREWYSPNYGSGYYMPTYTTIYNGPVAIGGNNCYNVTTEYDSTGVFGSYSSDFLYSKVIVSETQFKKIVIPAHYESIPDYPYLIKDTYKKIKLSPWFVNSTCSSLESALIKAKELIKMIGMDNVKVIKVVPIDQFVKIK